MLKPVKSTVVTAATLILFASGINIATSQEDPSDAIAAAANEARSEPLTDLSARPLAGKFARYDYHSMWQVRQGAEVKGGVGGILIDIFFYENGECEWSSIMPNGGGRQVRQLCATTEIAPNIYQITWLEAESREVVTMTLNLNSWSVNSSFHYNNGEGLSVLQGRIHMFGERPNPDITVPQD